MVATFNRRCLDRFDFFTLYTSIPYQSLKLSIKFLIEEALKVRGVLYEKWFCSTNNEHDKNIIIIQLVQHMVEYLVIKFMYVSVIGCLANELVFQGYRLCTFIGKLKMVSII